MFKKLNLKVFAQELIFFLAGYGLVYFGYKQWQRIPPVLQETYFSAKIAPFSLSSNSVFNNQALMFIIYFTLGTAIIYLALKKFKNPRLIINILFYLALVGGLNLFLAIIFNPTLQAQLWSILITLLIIFVRIKWPIVLIQNSVLILTIAGISFFFARQIQTTHLIWVLLLVAIYDFVAVYLTKHMVFMAKKIAQLGIGLFLILPRNLTDYLTIPKKGNLHAPGQKYVLLGGGDMAFPLILTANLASESLLISFIVFCFALVGLLISHLIFSFTQKPVPALPSIIFMSVLGYMIVKYLFPSLLFII